MGSHARTAIVAHRAYVVARCGSRVLILRTFANGDERPMITEADVLSALAKRYPPPGYAFLQHVRNRTGYGGGVRTADALAMSLWASQGMYLHGFEVKVSRSDWVREIKSPEKADEIAKFCDRWWVAVSDDSVVRD